MDEEEKLRLGKGVAFVKGRLKRLHQSDETWEADFQALPRPIDQSETHYLGMVVSGEGGEEADRDEHGADIELVHPRDSCELCDYCTVQGDLLTRLSTQTSIGWRV